MKPFFLTKLEALAIVSVPLALGLAVGALAAYLITRNRRNRRGIWENRKRPVTLEPRTL
jgi:hypothetical protein